MKNVLFIFCILLLFNNPARAQFRLGALGGVSVSRFVYEDEGFRDSYSSRFKTGYHAGVMLNYKVSPLYSLHTELSFLKKGINVRNRTEFGEMQNKAEYYYISVPALLRFSKHKYISAQHVEFYVNIGPEVNYWLGGQGVLEAAGTDGFFQGETLAYKVAFSEQQRAGNYMMVADPSRIQMAVAAGGGVIFDIGRFQNFAFDLRGSFGLGKSFHGKQEGGDYGLPLYAENLEGGHHTLTITASWFHSFDLNTAFRKGKISMAY